jgi:hypothetical protein
MEWYIRFKNKNTPPTWLKARNYQITNVENYIKHGIHPSNAKLTFDRVILKDNTIYTTYINEYGEIVEMLFDTPEKVAYINRITGY